METISNKQNLEQMQELLSLIYSKKKLYLKFHSVFVENKILNGDDEYYQKARDGTLLKIKLQSPNYLTSYIIKFKGFHFINQYYEKIALNFKFKSMIKNIMLITLADCEYLFAEKEIIKCIDASIMNFKNVFETLELKFKSDIIEIFSKNIQCDNMYDEPIDLLMFYPSNIYYNDKKYELIKKYNPKYVLGEFEGFIKDDKIKKYISNNIFLIKKKNKNLINSLLCYERKI